MKCHAITTNARALSGAAAFVRGGVALQGLGWMRSTNGQRSPGEGVSASP
jgi:hypothetical protein